MKNNHTLLWSIEALLLVLSILHISVCLPRRWLAGNAKYLDHIGFSYYDMALALDVMEDRLKEISHDAP